MNRKPVMQEDLAGCAVACVAFILNITYSDALCIFKNGECKVKYTGFFCKEIVSALKTAGLSYRYKYVKRQQKNHTYQLNSIVYIKKSQEYPDGHFLCNSEMGWMDPWINFPSLQVKAGFRNKLPGKSQYIIVPTVLM